MKNTSLILSVISLVAVVAFGVISLTGKNTADVATSEVEATEGAAKGDIVYKTKDYFYYKELEDKLEGEFRRFPLDLKVYAYPGANLVIEAEGLGCHFLYQSEEVLEEAKNSGATLDQVAKQMGKLGDTIFTLGQVEFEEHNVFLPVKMLNNARRDIVQALYDAKIASKQNRTKESAPKEKISLSDRFIAGLR